MSDVEHFLGTLFSYLYVFFGEMSIQVFCSFLNWDVFVVVAALVDLCELFVHFGN